MTEIRPSDEAMAQALFEHFSHPLGHTPWSRLPSWDRDLWLAIARMRIARAREIDAEQSDSEPEIRGMGNDAR